MHIYIYIFTYVFIHAPSSRVRYSLYHPNILPKVKLKLPNIFDKYVYIHLFT